jgi:Protein of unknown function (DUF2510)
MEGWANMVVSLAIVVVVLLVGLAVVAAIIAGIVLVVRAASKPSVPQPNPALPVMNLPAGWYPDPSHPNLMRYFDGRTWTASTHPRS